MLAAFEQCLTTIQPEIAFLLFLSMTAKTGSFEDGLNVLGVGQPRFGSGGWELAHVNFAQIPFVVIRAASGHGCGYSKEEVG